MLNFYRQFKALVPDAPLQVGDVLAVSNGIASVQFPGGGVLQARGQASVGQRVFVRDGAIEGPATTLTYVIAEV